MYNHLIGIGLRHQHLQEFASSKPEIGFVEVHSENYMSRGGIDYKLLLDISKHYPVSLHGVGMSIGSCEELSKEHLSSLKHLIYEIKPIFVSEHLSWSSHDGIYMPELITFPFNTQTLDNCCRKLDYLQEYLDCEIMIENPSSYFLYSKDITNYSEAEFLNKLCKKTGAKILLDVNNIYVSSSNNGTCPKEYIDAVEERFVKEIHLAGHSSRKTNSTTGAKTKNSLLIDSHDNHVSTEVWELYEYLIEKTGPVHSLLEWDMDLPTLDALIAEANQAKNFMKIVAQ